MQHLLNPMLRIIVHVERFLPIFAGLAASGSW